MSRVENVITVDDLDGSEGAEKFVFACDGVAYEIDLSEANLAPVREVLAPLVEKGRKIGRVTGGSKAGRRTAAFAGSGDAGQIRAWCREHGIDVSERGRIAASLREQYHAAH